MDDEPSNQSFFRLHEAFQHPFQKMMGQGMYIIFVITILNMVNIQTLHSNNLEIAIEVSLLTVVLWVLVGAYIIYYA